MAHQWKAGDLAVRVRVPDGILPEARRVPNSMKVGGVYRVAEVLVHLGRVGLVIDGHASLHPTKAWGAEMFRPILPAEPCFAEAMRSLRPKVEA